MKNAFDPQRIQQAWAPLDWKSPQIIGGEALRYAQYYGIDFAARFANLHHAFGYFEAAGHDIAVHAWMSEKSRGTVLVCHGYFDRSTNTTGRRWEVICTMGGNTSMSSTIFAAIICRSVEPKSVFTVSRAVASP